MIDQQTVYDTCQNLAREGPVSFRKLYARLGGNRGNVRQWWHQWQREYGEEDPLLPEAFTTSMQKFLQVDEWEARYQALTQTLVPAAEERLATLDAQCHAAEEQLQTLRAHATVLHARVAALTTEEATITAQLYARM